MSNWKTICAATELVEGLGVCALVGEEQVAIFKLPGSEGYAAIQNYCPFAKANVLSRGIVGDLKGSTVVASPIYKQHFDLKTGRCLEDIMTKLKVFEVREKDGQLEVAA